MKIKNYIEEIFSQAVALDQSSNMRNTIYALNNEIFIMNYDHTILLRFRLRKSEDNFKTPISFKANDYDSNEFEQVGDKIIFRSENENYIRKKTCGISDLTAEQAREIFLSFSKIEDDFQSVIISKNILGLLDDNLSHIEFHGEKGKPLKLIQRNIYSGGIIEIEKKSGGLFTDEFEFDFGPLGIKTNDFQALFNFQSNVRFYFSKKHEDYIIVKSIDNNVRDFKGIIACCIYDEIIKIKEVQNGREKQKIRRGKQKTD